MMTVVDAGSPIKIINRAKVRPMEEDRVQSGK
jgi:hypothetical protein